MSLLVVIAVSLLAYLYLKTTRTARKDWLAKLNLPGRWMLQADDGRSIEMLLQGQLHAGQFSWHDGEKERRGAWSLRGHTLSLGDADEVISYDLHLFAPGKIGLEKDNGQRLIFEKASSNVVTLKQRDGSSA